MTPRLETRPTRKAAKRTLCRRAGRWAPSHSSRQIAHLEAVQDGEKHAAVKCSAQHMLAQVGSSAVLIACLCSASILASQPKPSTAAGASSSDPLPDLPAAPPAKREADSDQVEDGTGDYDEGCDADRSEPMHVRTRLAHACMHSTPPSPPPPTNAVHADHHTNGTGPGTGHRWYRSRSPSCVRSLNLPSTSSRLLLRLRDRWQLLSVRDLLVVAPPEAVAAKARAVPRGRNSACPPRSKRSDARAKQDVKPAWLNIPNPRFAWCF